LLCANIFPYPTLFRSALLPAAHLDHLGVGVILVHAGARRTGAVRDGHPGEPLALGREGLQDREIGHEFEVVLMSAHPQERGARQDRKSTRLNSSHEWL